MKSKSSPFAILTDICDLLFPLESFFTLRLGFTAALLLGNFDFDETRDEWDWIFALSTDLTLLEACVRSFLFLVELDSKPKSSSDVFFVPEASFLSFFLGLADPGELKPKSCSFLSWKETLLELRFLLTDPDDESL